MNRNIWLVLLLAAPALSGGARAQEAGRSGEAVQGSIFGLPGIALRAESLFGSTGSSGADRFAPEDAGASQASLSSSLGSRLPATALFGAAEQQDLLNYYVELRAGPMFFINDLTRLNPGLDAEVAVGYYPLNNLAVELTTGFIGGESPDGTIDRAWAIPIVANAKLVLPMGPFETYAGAGLGAYFVRVEVGTSTLEACDCDWVFGGNAFLGINYDIAPSVMIGGEVKYILTASAPAGDGRASLEGFAFLLGVGIRF